jgi:histidinol dehydrogenase
MRVWQSPRREARTLVVIADASADPARLAADLVDGVAQLAWPRTSVVALGAEVATAVFDAIAAELGAASGVVARTWAGRGGVYVAEDVDDAVQIALRLAPLKVAVRVADPQPVLESLADASARTLPGAGSRPRGEA